MIGKLIYATLKNNTEVNSIVEGRIFPVKGDQSEVLPAIIYIIENEESLNPPGMDKLLEHQVRISLYGDNYIILDTLGDAVQTALENATAPTGFEFEAAYLMDLDDGIDHEINAYNKDLVMRILTHKTI